MLFSKTGSVYGMEDMAIPGIGFTYENWQPAYMKETLHTLDAPLVRPVEEVIIPGNNRVRMLTFLQPLPVGGSHSPGVVIILVKGDTILHMMGSVSVHYLGDFFILDEQGQLLVASNGSLVRSSDDLASLVDRMERENSGDLTSVIHQIKGTTYIVSYAVSDKNGWQYVSRCRWCCEISCYPTR
ncbi:cache domain-containing protein [Paenibacillus barengoltzii]|nr:cache domain-containing protein [Paenibacillus barengoltzii]